MGIEELINRGRKGDEKALYHLYNTYSHKMVRICVKIVGNRMIAEELAHDAFILAFAKLDQLQNPKRFGNWLATITSNVALRYLEQNNAHQTISLTDISDEEIDKQIGSDEENTDKALPPFEILMAAIDNLPKGYGNVFKMSVIQEMTHAEIANILGIAAHSSSSQLARAKKLLRKSLSSYWSIILAMLLGSFAAYMFFRQQHKESHFHPTASTHDVEPKNEAITNSTTNMVDSIVTPISPIPAIPLSTNTQIAATPRHNTIVDSGSNNYNHSKTEIIVQSQHAISIADSTHIGIDTLQLIAKSDSATNNIGSDTSAMPNVLPQHIEPINQGSYTAQQQEFDLPLNNKPQTSKWTLNLAYSGAIGEAKNNNPSTWWTDKNVSNIYPDGIEMKYNFTYWSDLLLYADNAQIPLKEKEAIKKVANRNILQGKNKIGHTSHHHLPFSISMALQHRLNDRWGIESGLSYTHLSSQFVAGESQAGYVENQKIHYLGIPLKISYNWLNTKHWNIYSSTGATFELPVRASISTDYQSRSISLFHNSKSFDAPIQWSTSISVGAQYNITPSLGIFAEPGATYFIPQGSEIETYRTQHPFSVTIPIGLRFRW